MALKYTIFFAILACVSGVNETQDCSVSRFVDFCYYNHYCACMGDHERRTDVVLTADCVNSTHTNVSWEAPSANLVNLQYSCFWSENDARLSGNYPVDFERSSQYTTGSKIVETIPPIVAGVYCKFFGCIESDHICGYQYFTANAVCGKRLGVNSTVVMSTSSQTASSTFLTAQPSIIPILMNNDTTTVSSSTKSTESSPSFPTTNADGSGDGTAFVIPIVLVFVVIVSATALLFSCFSFYRCRRSKADYNYERQLTQVDKVPEKIAPPLDILSTTYPVLSGSVLTVFNSLIYNDDKSTCMMKEQVTDSGYAKMDDGNDYASVSTEKADDELKFIRGDLVDDDSSECFCKGTTVAFPVSPDPCIVTNMKFHLDLSEREELHHGRTESLSSGYLTTTEACNPMSPFANTSGCTIQSSLPPSLSLSDHNLANRTTSNEIKTDSLPSLLPTASSHVHSSAITLEESHPRANVLTHDSATTSDYIESNQYSSTPMFNGCMEYRESDDAISLPDCDLCEVEIEGKEITITIQPNVIENVTSHYIRQESQKDCLPAGHQDSISFHSLDVEEGELETSESSSSSYPSFLQDPQIHPTEILGIQQMFVSDGGYLESSVCQPSVLATTLPLSHPYKEDLDDSFHFCEEGYQPGYVSSSEVSAPYLSSSTSLTKFGINHNSTFLSTVSNMLTTTTTTTTMYASVDHDNDDCYIRDSCSATDTIIHPGSTSEEDARQLSSAHTSGELHRSPSPLSMYSLSSSFEVNGCSSVSGTD